MAQKKHLSPDGQFRPCNATGKCPVAPEALHFEDVNSKEAVETLDRYNELRANGYYSNVVLSDMLNPSRDISEKAFILNKESVSNMKQVDLLIIKEETKKALESVDKDYFRLKSEIDEVESKLVNLEKEYKEISGEEGKESWIKNYYEENNLVDEEQEPDTLHSKADLKVYFKDDTVEDIKDANYILITDGDNEYYQIKGYDKEVERVVFSNTKQRTEALMFRSVFKRTGNGHQATDNFRIAEQAYLEHREKILTKVNNQDSKLAQMKYDLYNIEVEKIEKEEIMKIVENELEK